MNKTQFGLEWNSGHIVHLYAKTLNEMNWENCKREKETKWEKQSESMISREFDISNYEREPISTKSILQKNKYIRATHDDLIRKHFKSFRYLRKFG